MHPKAMNVSETIDAQVTLPVELYQSIAQQAVAHGQSVSEEIVALLSSLLMPLPDELADEFAAWEAASDEDWLALENAIQSRI